MLFGNQSGNRSHKRRSSRRQKAHRRNASTRRIQLVESLEDRRLMAVAGGFASQLAHFGSNWNQHSGFGTDQVQQGPFQSNAFGLGQAPAAQNIDNGTLGLRQQPWWMEQAAQPGGDEGDDEKKPQVENENPENSDDKPAAETETPAETKTPAETGTPADSADEESSHGSLGEVDNNCQDQPDNLPAQEAGDGKEKGQKQENKSAEDSHSVTKKVGDEGTVTVTSNKPISESLEKICDETTREFISGLLKSAEDATDNQPATEGVTLQVKIIVIVTDAETKETIRFTIDIRSTGKPSELLEKILTLVEESQRDQIRTLLTTLLNIDGLAESGQPLGEGTIRFLVFTCNRLICTGGIEGVEVKDIFVGPLPPPTEPDSPAPEDQPADSKGSSKSKNSQGEEKKSKTSQEKSKSTDSSKPDRKVKETSSSFGGLGSKIGFGQLAGQVFNTGFTGEQWWNEQPAHPGGGEGDNEENPKVENEKPEEKTLEQLQEQRAEIQRQHEENERKQRELDQDGEMDAAEETQWSELQEEIHRLRDQLRELDQKILEQLKEQTAGKEDELNQRAAEIVEEEFGVGSRGTSLTPGTEIAPHELKRLGETDSEFKALVEEVHELEEVEKEIDGLESQNAVNGVDAEDKKEGEEEKQEKPNLSYAQKREISRCLGISMYDVDKLLEEGEVDLDMAMDSIEKQLDRKTIDWSKLFFPGPDNQEEKGTLQIFFPPTESNEEDQPADEVDRTEEPEASADTDSSEESQEPQDLDPENSKQGSLEGTDKLASQPGSDCEHGSNCRPDPRFTNDPENYTTTFTNGYPAESSSEPGDNTENVDSLFGSDPTLGGPFGLPQPDDFFSGLDRPFGMDDLPDFSDPILIEPFGQSQPSDFIWGVDGPIVGGDFSGLNEPILVEPFVQPVEPFVQLPDLNWGDIFGEDQWDFPGVPSFESPSDDEKGTVKDDRADEMNDLDKQIKDKQDEFDRHDADFEKEVKLGQETGHLNEGNRAWDAFRGRKEAGNDLEDLKEKKQKLADEQNAVGQGFGSMFFGL